MASETLEGNYFCVSFKNSNLQLTPAFEKGWL